MGKAKWKNFTDQELKEIVKNNISFRAVQQALGYNTNSGSVVLRLKKVFDDKGIDYSHFKGQAWNKKDEQSYSDFGITNWQGVKEKILQERPYKCEKCGISEWQGQKLLLQVHHIDGNRYNNTRENLQILCPNCHSLTDNWCHKKNGIQVSDDEFLIALSDTPNIYQACKKLNITPNQHNYARAKKLLKQLE